MWEPILLSGLAGAITILGILLVVVWHRRALQYSHYINSFAAGLLLAAGLTALLPRGMEQNAHAPLFALIGFSAFLVLETFLVVHAGAEFHYADKARIPQRGAVFFWGLFLHSFLDGVVIAVGFATGPRIGLVTAIAVVSHELPEGITAFSLLLQHIDRRSAAVRAVAVALATPVGGVIGVLSLPALESTVMGAASAAVAGSFIYIAGADIVPEIREKNAVSNLGFLLAGMLFLIGVHHLLH
ncbi:MAG: ZIP family metal transporter [Planctomycetota bacterium]